MSAAVYTQRPSDETWEEWETSVCEQLDIDKGDLPMILGRIESLGIIQRVVAGRSEQGFRINRGRPTFKITRSFERLMRFAGQVAG